MVVGVGSDKVEEAIAEALPAPEGVLRFATQAEQRGTADAVMAGLTEIPEEAETVLILCGDVPGLPTGRVRELLDARAAGADLALLTFEPEEPGAYGRVLRDASGALAAAKCSASTCRVTSKGVLKAGSSKQGNAVRAERGSIWVKA